MELLYVPKSKAIDLFPEPLRELELTEAEWKEFGVPKWLLYCHPAVRVEIGIAKSSNGRNISSYDHDSKEGTYDFTILTNSYEYIKGYEKKVSDQMMETLRQKLEQAAIEFFTAYGRPR